MCTTCVCTTYYKNQKKLKYTIMFCIACRVMQAFTSIDIVCMPSTTVPTANKTYFPHTNSNQNKSK